MSSKLGSVQGSHHEISVSRSNGTVELGIWTEPPTKGFGDGMTPDAARGLAALLIAAADSVDKSLAERLKSV